MDIFFTFSKDLYKTYEGDTTWKYPMMTNTHRLMFRGKEERSELVKMQIG